MNVASNLDIDFIMSSMEPPLHHHEAKTLVLPLKHAIDFLITHKVNTVTRIVLKESCSGVPLQINI